MPTRASTPEQHLEHLIAHGIRLPPQPKVLVELQRTLAADDYSLKTLSHLIASDPGITAMLFKVAGSPIFGSHRNFDSIEQVLTLIGVKQTFNLVQAISLASTLTDGNRKTFEMFWTRSQEIAQMAAVIAAERVSVCNIFPDQAYMTGIFHDCGVPVLMLRFPEYCQKLNLETEAYWPSLALEDKYFNVDHSSIGYLVAHHWKLPDFICQAILHHHEMPQERYGAVRTLVAILQLAIHFYHRLVHIDDADVWGTLRDETLSELGIPQDGEQLYFEEIRDKLLG